MGEPTKIEIGEEIRPSGYAAIALGAEPYLAKGGCDNKKNGRWFCVGTHRIKRGQFSSFERFDNQLQKDCHLSGTKEPCRLGWWCFEHGPEVP